MVSIGVISGTANIPLSGSGFRNRKELKVQAAGLLMLFILWGSTASAFESWSEDSAANTGYCADCHGDFGSFMYAGPQYVSLKKYDADGQSLIWKFTGSAGGDPVSLMDIHSSVVDITPEPELDAPLSCFSCHDSFGTAPVLLNSTLADATCVNSGCHGSTELRVSHRVSSKFQTMATSLALPEETKNCNGSSCHDSGADTDGDGIPDAVDLCPDQGSGTYGLDDTGCPINSATDSDNDGIYDSVDTCPNTPTNETANSQGCSTSQIDTDGDGVLDKNDECPEDGDEGEGVDDEGCPIPPFSLATLLGGGGSISPYSTLVLLLIALTSLRHRNNRPAAE